MSVATFDVAGASLPATLSLVETEHKTVTHWRQHGPHLLLLTAPDEHADTHPLPGRLLVTQCEGFVRSWLEAQTYPSEPPCDGHCRKSWRVRHQPPKIEGEDYARYVWQVALVVTPHWNEYHK